MNKTQKTLVKQLTDKIDELLAERDAIDKQVDALRTAAETLAGAAVRAPRRGYRLDKKARARTLEFMSTRKRPTTVSAVARKFNITDSAANQRLLALAKAGDADRVATGKYVLAQRGN